MTVEVGDRIRDFELPNVAAGPDPFSVSDRPEDVSFVVLFFQRDHYCTNCRQQVRGVTTRIEEFRERNAEVVSIVPEPEERVDAWQDRYEPSYPLLADPEAEIGTAYDQPVRFSPLGRVSGFLGRMPAVVNVDRRGEVAEVAYVYRGTSTFDRPEIDDLLGELDDLRSS